MRVKSQRHTHESASCNTEIIGLAVKGTLVPELRKALTLEMTQDRCPKSSWTCVFTDGSAENAVRNRGSGATSSLSIPAGDLSPSYRAEVHAPKAATEHLIEEDCNQQNIVLLSDSLSTLQSLTNGLTDLSHSAAIQKPVYSVKQKQSIVLQ